MQKYVFYVLFSMFSFLTVQGFGYGEMEWQTGEFTKEGVQIWVSFDRQTYNSNDDIFMQIIFGNDSSSEIQMLETGNHMRDFSWEIINQNTGESAVLTIQGLHLLKNRHTVFRRQAISILPEARKAVSINLSEYFVFEEGQTYKVRLSGSFRKNDEKIDYKTPIFTIEIGENETQKASTSEEDVTVTISFDQKVYDSADDIIARMTYANHSSSEIQIGIGHPLFDFTWEIINQTTGKPIALIKKHDINNLKKIPATHSTIPISIIPESRYPILPINLSRYFVFEKGQTYKISADGSFYKNDKKINYQIKDCIIEIK